MALEDLKPGMTATLSVVAAPEHFASKIVSGTPDVFSTPALGALVEKTAAEWVGAHLAADQMTVGAQNRHQPHGRHSGRPDRHGNGHPGRSRGSKARLHLDRHRWY